MDNLFKKHRRQASSSLGGYHYKEAFFFIGGWGVAGTTLLCIIKTMIMCLYFWPYLVAPLLNTKINYTLDKSDNHYLFAKQFQITLHCVRNFSVLNNTILYKELVFICSSELFDGQRHLKMCSYSLNHKENLSYSVVWSGQYYCNCLNTTEEYTCWFPNTHPLPYLTSKWSKRYRWFDGNHVYGRKFIETQFKFFIIQVKIILFIDIFSPFLFCFHILHTAIQFSDLKGYIQK